MLRADRGLGFRGLDARPKLPASTKPQTLTSQHVSQVCMAGQAIPALRECSFDVLFLFYPGRFPIVLDDLYNH